MIRYIPPAETPAAVTLIEAKLQLKVETDEEDSLINTMIAAATSVAEHETGCALVSQDWTAQLDRFPPRGIRLAHPPIISVESIEYTREDGVVIVLDTDQYRAFPDGCLMPAAEGWPAGSDVQIKYKAGFGTIDDVPSSVKQWILLHVGSTYVHRETVQAGNLVEMPYIKHLLDRYRIWNVV